MCVRGIKRHSILAISILPRKREKGPTSPQDKGRVESPAHFFSALATSRKVRRYRKQLHELQSAHITNIRVTSGALGGGEKELYCKYMSYKMLTN